MDAVQILSDSTSADSDCSISGRLLVNGGKYGIYLNRIFCIGLNHTSLANSKQDWDRSQSTTTKLSN